MSTLVFDIETVGQPFAEFDQLTQHKLLDAAALKQPEAHTKETLQTLAEEPLGLSPFTGKIIAIACIEVESKRGGVYFEAPGETHNEQDESGCKYQSMDEAKILRKFWDLALHCNEFVTYNGRGFDLPYIMLRSAVHGIRPPKNISKARYLYQMDKDAIHIDLFDQLTFYRALSGGNLSLHMACQAFGITSPKQGGMDGSKVAEAFEQKRYKEIAEYCLADVVATAELFEKWNRLLRF